MDPTLTPDQEAMSRAVMSAARGLVSEAILGALWGDPSIQCGRIGNTDRNAIFLVVIGTSEQTDALWERMDAPVKEFCAKNGMTYRGVEFDQPGGE